MARSCTVELHDRPVWTVAHVWRGLEQDIAWVQQCSGCLGDPTDRRRARQVMQMRGKSFCSLVWAAEANGECSREGHAFGA